MADDSGTNEQYDEFDAPLEDSTAMPLAADTGGAIESGGTAESSANTLPLDLVKDLAREGLATIPGETEAAAARRLSSHLFGKSTAYYNDIRRLRQAEETHVRRFNELRTGLEPMLRDYHQRQRMAQVEEQAAQIPDKETDPTGYQIWLQEETIRRDDERRQQEWQQAQDAQRNQADAEFQDQLAAIDNSGYTKVAEGLGLAQGSQPDPEFAHAYEVYSESAMAAAKSYFPDASDGQLQEFIGLSQQLDIRRAEMNGVDIREVMKGRLNGLVESLVRRGLVTRAQAGQGQGQGQGGQQTPANKPAASAQTVAQRVQGNASAAARRAPSAVPTTTRPSPLPGQLPDASALEEDDFVEAALAGLLGNEEQRAAPHRKSR